MNPPLKPAKSRNRDVLIEVGDAAVDRTKMFSAIRVAVGVRGSVRELFPHVEVEVFGLDPTTDSEDVRDVINKHFVDSATGDMKANISEKAFRGCPKAYVE